jgi:HAMP domain-containing protein
MAAAGLDVDPITVALVAIPIAILAAAISQRVLVRPLDRLKRAIPY